MRKNAQFIFLLLLVLLVALTFHPAISGSGDIDEEARGTILTPVILICFAILTVICINRGFLTKNFLSRRYLVMYVVIVAVALAILAAGLPHDMLIGDCRAMLITFVALCIGGSMTISKRQLIIVLYIFCIASAIVGLLQIFINGNGFVIERYFAWQKNALGCLVATAAVISMALAIDKDNVSKKNRRVAAVIVGIEFLVLLTIRARAAMLSAAVIIIFMYYCNNRSKNYGRMIFVTIAVLVALFVILPSSVTKYIYDSMFFGAAEYDLTSGRSERSSAALAYLAQHPLLGNLDNLHKIPPVHIYPLWKIYSYGMVLSLPILALYLYIGIFCIRKCWKERNVNIMNSGVFVMLVPLIVSLAEYTLPFGPGTVTVLNFVLLGLSANYYENKLNVV